MSIYIYIYIYILTLHHYQYVYSRWKTKHKFPTINLNIVKKKSAWIKEDVANTNYAWKKYYAFWDMPKVISRWKRKLNWFLIEYILTGLFYITYRLINLKVYFTVQIRKLFRFQKSIDNFLSVSRAQNTRHVTKFSYLEIYLDHLAFTLGGYQGQVKIHIALGGESMTSNDPLARSIQA